MKQQNDFKRHAKCIGMLLPLLMAGCSDEMHVFRPDDGASGLRIELQAGIDQTADTRADESGFADGDRFGLFVVNYSDGQPGELTLSANQVNNVAMTYNADSNSWQSATDIYWRDPITPADVYGYYPFSNGLSSTSAYSFEVRADQSVKGEAEMGAYEASDFLWAKTAKATPGKKVELTFGHAMAGVKVVLQQGDGFDGDAWTKLEKTVTVDNTIRTSEIDLSTGTVTPVGSFDRNVVMNPEGDAWRAVVVPQVVAAGKSTIGITIDGKSYAYTRSDGMKYTAGKLHTFTIKIDRKGDGGDYTLTLVDEAITPWEADKSSHDFEASSYVVVHVEEAGTLKSCLREMGCDISTLRNLKVTGQLTDEDFRMMREEMDQLSSIHLGDARMVHVECALEVEGSDYWNSPRDFIDDVLPEDGLYGKSSIRRVILPNGLKRVGRNALRELRLTSTLLIPESVKRIDDGAFCSIGDDATIIMPSSLEYIGGMAFYGLGATMELKLSNKLKYIGWHAFTDARGATGIFSLPSGLEYIGDHAFQSCGHDLVGDLVLPTAITDVPEECFAGMGFVNGTRLTLHEGVKRIGANAFSGLKFNSRFSFPNNLKEIGMHAFGDCRFTGSPILPNGIIYLAPSVFTGSNYSGEVIFPESLDMVQAGINEWIGACHDFGSAFRRCDITSLVLGDNILQVGMAAFEGCHELQSIRMGKNVGFIAERAFSEVPALTTFVCLAPEPPTAFDSSFTEMQFDKVILEVPENAVELYRHAEGWKKFQNITPHHELAFNIPEILCLDKGMTRQGIIRSEGAWSVAECPSWVHVSPDHADYKEELTITVDAMPAGTETREGEIVFKLNGKDYTTYTSVHQLAFDHPQDTEVVLQEASAGAKEIPVFIVGEGFGAEKIVNGEYMRRMDETMEQLFAIEPYKSYRNYFTVTTSIACSPDEGTGDVFSVKTNCFDTDGVSPDVGKLRSYVEKVSAHAGKDMDNALIIMVSNYNGFTGWSEIDWNGCSMAGIGIVDDVYPYDQRGLVQRFAGGEAFAGLGNEMVVHFEHIKGCTCPFCNAMSRYLGMKERGYFENLTMSSKMSDAPWKDFIFHPKYSQMVDMWEGGYNHLRGVWRSEPNSVMNNYIAYFNTISRYTIYKEIMRRAGVSASLEDFIANDKIELPQ